MDRFIQQALLQVLQERWDLSFSETSFGFRTNRSAHQAVSRAQKDLRAGYRWVVDMDLEKFFDRVNHDQLMGEVRKRVSERRVVQLIRRFLQAGVLEDGAIHETDEGPRKGGHFLRYYLRRLWEVEASRHQRKAQRESIRRQNESPFHTIGIGARLLARRKGR